MKRRQLLKSLSLVAGDALCSRQILPIFGMHQDRAKVPPLAIAIRGLTRKQGALVQPIQITVDHSGSDAECLTRMDGSEVDKRVLTAGPHVFRVFTPPVSAPRDTIVEVEINGKVNSARVTLQPVRKTIVYILPHSHHDLGYTALQSEVEEKQIQNITKGMELARNTAGNPEGSRFVWNLEVLWGADLFMRRRPEAEKAAFIEAVKKGWVALHGMYANELTGLCRPEELLQLFWYSGELGRQCGVTVDSAMLSDVPGFTWGTVTAMSQAGIRYFSAAPNYFDRIGSFMAQWQDKPFWWLSPSGKEKVLVWVPWTGYAMSHIMKPNVEWVGKYQARLDSIKFPYEISYIRWSGHGDNAEPDPEICEFVKAWNQDYEWPKFSIASTHTAFSALESRHGKELPEFRGDLTPYWEDGAGSSALETRTNRLSAERLTQAETLAAVLSPGDYSPGDFHEAWRNILLYSEHTWGAWCSVSDSENSLTTEQWKVKRGFALDGQKQSEALLANVLRSYASKQATSAIDIHNSASWDRTEVIVLPKEMSVAGDHVTEDSGAAVPSQRLSTGDLAFLAYRVPAFGSARFEIWPAKKSHRPEKVVSVQNGVLDNGILRARFDLKTGNVIELLLHGMPGNLVDTSGGGSLNEYLFLEGKGVSKIQTSGPAKITVEESGPFVASLRIESPAPGCVSLVRRARLVAGADWLELSNVVDKKQAALNPHPGEGGPSDEFAQRGSKESLQFAFPFAVPDGKICINIPFAVVQPETDQLPGSCKNWLPVGRWIDVANDSRGVTWVSLDAPLVEVGDITATLLGSQTKTSVWREHIPPTQKFYSWVMNNHWGTNYRAYQKGPVEFRYVVRPHRGYDPTVSNCLAIGLTQPLQFTYSTSNPVTPSLLRIEPEDVLALTCKHSEDGKAWIVRLFGASGESRRAKLRWRNGTPMHIWRSNLKEEPLELLKEEIDVAGWGLVTIRAEFS